MLPLGSVVYMREGMQKIMIVNRGSIVEQDGEQVCFDYTGVKYPNGINPTEVYYFNAEDIDQVIFEGFKDEEEQRFLVLYDEWLTTRPKMKKGRVKVSSNSSTYDA
jgi:hypothetical protein